METILMNKRISVASIDYLLSVATNQPDGVSRQRLLNIDTRSVWFGQADTKDELNILIAT